jgi:hypothetical protein
MKTAHEYSTLYRTMWWGDELLIVDEHGVQMACVRLLSRKGRIAIIALRSIRLHHLVGPQANPREESPFMSRMISDV